MLADTVNQLVFKRDNMRLRMDELYQAGWIGREQGWRVPSVIWMGKERNYLVLGFGRCAKWYVGCGSDAIARALAGVDRQKEYIRLKDAVDKIEALLNKVDGDLISYTFDVAWY